MRIVALVQENFLRLHPTSHSVEYGDISEREALRRRLQCHSFSWYLQTVYPALYSSGPSQQPLPPLPGIDRWQSKTRNLTDKIQVQVMDT